MSPPAPLCSLHRPALAAALPALQSLPLQQLQLLHLLPVLQMTSWSRMGLLHLRAEQPPPSMSLRRLRNRRLSAGVDPQKRPRLQPLQLGPLLQLTLQTMPMQVAVAWPSTACLLRLPQLQLPKRGVPQMRSPLLPQVLRRLMVQVTTRALTLLLLLLPLALSRLRPQLRASQPRSASFASCKRWCPALKLLRQCLESALVRCEHPLGLAVEAVRCATIAIAMTMTAATMMRAAVQEAATSLLPMLMEMTQLTRRMHMPATASMVQPQLMEMTAARTSTTRTALRQWSRHQRSGSVVARRRLALLQTPSQLQPPALPHSPRDLLRCRHRWLQLLLLLLVVESST